ncbi:MAG: hypothetical protein HYV67_01130, partial [Candidatus Taylorbacteria bacterium]|nr:hypothetical protein [Candidatus Taylorbacteria bacterium]
MLHRGGRCWQYFYPNNLMALFVTLKTRKPLPTNSLASRIFWIPSPSVMPCASGVESEKIREFFKIDTTDVSELRGTTACRGKVRGQARLIFKKEDLEKVKPGDILVTSMTTPNMVPTMKRAAAFITDEGGITSHAA